MNQNLVCAYRTMKDAEKKFAKAKEYFYESIIEELSESSSPLTPAELLDENDSPLHDEDLISSLPAFLRSMKIQQSRGTKNYHLQSERVEEQYYIAEVDRNGRVLSDPKSRKRARTVYSVHR